MARISEQEVEKENKNNYSIFVKSPLGGIYNIFTRNHLSIHRITLHYILLMCEIL